ncbi:MAG: hypothetical protein HC888_11600 [Candidatus Competibacteraceae bacterium]|nr:hypothetical protein [Candidatus Competibacteraceae bacterium]
MFQRSEASGDYHKELYKLELRLVTLPQLSLDVATAFDKKDEITKQVRRHFGADFPGRPFFPELVQEVLAEDYGPDSAALHADVLASVEVKEEKPKTTSHEISFTAMLQEALRTLAAVSRYLDEAIAKLSDNSFILENRKVSFIEHLRRWLLKAVQSQPKPLIYDVEYFDITTSTSKHEQIDFRVFADEVRKRAKLYAGILGKMGTVYKKIESAAEDQLYGFLNKNLEEVNIFHRRMQALDTYFKSEVPREQRSAVRGIKIELTAIKNNLVKANQKKHEYVARKEETEQLRKLGVNVNVS